MSISVSCDGPVKKISSCVRPGVCEVRASARRPVSALISLDLPTLERPATAISMPRMRGSAAADPAAAANCQSPANSLRPASISARVKGCVVILSRPHAEERTKCASRSHKRVYARLPTRYGSAHILRDTSLRDAPQDEGGAAAITQIFVRTARQPYRQWFGAAYTNPNARASCHPTSAVTSTPTAIIREPGGRLLLRANVDLRLSHSSILAPCLCMITLCWATESVLFQAQ